MDAGYFVETGDVLANKLGISDAKELEEAEYTITDEKLGEAIVSEHVKTFDFDYLLHLHKLLFEDIYDFAGKVRTVNISKPNSPVPFCYVDFIPSEATRIFGELARDNYLIGLDQPEFSEKLAYYASELNALHPFREGNGRTNRLFLLLLCRNAGYFIDFSLASRRAILHADTEAFSGNLQPIKDLYRQIILKI